jgi:uncharacterized phage-associated protein
LRIKTCRIFDNLAKDKKLRRPIAIFNCNCGFIYQRLGPDRSDEDKFRYDSVKQYGDVWEDELTKNWANLNLSLTEIAQKFGTTTHLITRHAIRLNLPRNSENTRSLQGYANHFNPRMSFSQNLDKYRNTFLELRKKNPKANRTILMTKANFTLQWLYRNDKKWLEAHLPKHGRVYPKSDHFDWSKIDKDISKQVKSVAREIRQFSGKPIRISITEIIRRIGQKGWIEKRKEKLPLTAKAIAESLETLEAYMVRKLLWAENKFLKEKTVPTKNQIIRRATINNSTTQNSTKIQNEIERSLDRIRNQFEQY